MTTWLVDSAIQAQIHREVAVTILNDALTWGTISQAAEQAGISRKYLWHLRRMDVEPLPKLPSPQVATQVVKSLPLPPEQQRDLLEHLLLARETLQVSVNRLRRDAEWLEGHAIWELTRLHELATFSRSPQEARVYYCALRDLGHALTGEFHRARLTLSAARAHAFVTDAMNVLGQPGAALYHAKMARWLVEGREDEHLCFYDPRTGQEQVTDVYELQVNAIRSEAVGYNEFGSYAGAALLCDRALRNEAVSRSPDIWKPHILRDKLDALGRDPRVPRDDLEACAAEARSICEDGENGIGLFLINNVVARAYLVRGLNREAGDILRQNRSLLRLCSSGGNIGQLHEAMLYSRLADLHHQEKNEEAWQHYVAQALTIAHHAGLVEVYRGLLDKYNEHPLFKTLDAQIAASRPDR
jgi:hypothetical protein